MPKTRPYSPTPFSKHSRHETAPAVGLMTALLDRRLWLDQRSLRPQQDAPSTGWFQQRCLGPHRASSPGMRFSGAGRGDFRPKEGTARRLRPLCRRMDDRGEPGKAAKPGTEPQITWLAVLGMLLRLAGQNLLIDP